MSQYLRFRTGDFRFLLSLEAIVEIGAVVAGDDTGGRRLWREQALPVLDLAAWLGAPLARRAQQLVLSEADALHLVDIDEVEGLMELEEGQFVRITEVSPALAALVDAVAAEAGVCLLRLRQPLAWQPGLAGGTPAENPT
ncbi:MAG: hypothetical protein V4729_10555 [Pseudomonadota bacterium]